MTPSQIKAGYFNTDYGYPYQWTGGGEIRMPTERTIAAGIGRTAPNNYIGLGYRYSVKGHVVQRNASSASATLTGNDASFNATTLRLAI